MAKKPPDGKPDPMARDVDRLLAQLALFGHPAPRRSEAPQPGGSRSQLGRPRIGRPVEPLRPGPSSNGAVSVARPLPAETPQSPEGRSHVGLWARVLLGGTFGILMTQWPYENACGMALLEYGGAVGAVMITGGWLAFESWRFRNGLAHVIALLLFYWGLVLAGAQVIPRIGNVSHRPSWRCSAPRLGLEQGHRVRPAFAARLTLRV